METKFTKGEWNYISDNEYPTLHQIWNNGKIGYMPTYIARTCYAPSSEANAKLIAAAPDLFNALSSFMDFPKEDLYAWIIDGKPIEITVRASQFADAMNALQKATK